MGETARASSNPRIPPPCCSLGFIPSRSMSSTNAKKSRADSSSAMKISQIPSPSIALRIKEETPNHQSPPTNSLKTKPPSPSLPLHSVKTESFALPVPATQPSPALATPPSEVSKEEPLHPVLKAMSDLRTLSTALSAFNLCFEEFQLHLDSINESLAKKLQGLEAHKLLEKAPNVEPEQPAKLPKESPDGKSIADELQGLDALKPQENSPNLEPEQPAKLPEAATGGKPAPAEQPRPLLELICQAMNGKKLRSYVASHLSKVLMLREEIPDALTRFAPDPARLTLNSLCRFFVQGSKAYADKNSKMITLRRAAVRILEFFILAGCPKVEESVKVEAEASAVLWKTRLLREGGVANACYEDAIGLVLLLAAYRVASVFEIDDLGKLVELSQVWKKTGALRRSPHILEFIQDIIEVMLKNEMYAQAISLVLRFDLKDKFDPESLLSFFLNKTDKNEKKLKEDAQGSLEALKEASERTLSALKSVVKCVEESRYNSEELSNYKIKEKIASLEKEIVAFAPKVDEKPPQKRKAKEFGSSENARHQAVKRHQPTATSFPSPANTVMPSISRTLHDEPQSRNIIVNPNFPGLIDGYSAVSAKPAGYLSEGNVTGLTTASMLGTSRTIGGVSVGNRIGLPAGNDVAPYPVVSNLSPAGNSGRLSTDGGVGAYGWNREIAFNSPSNRQSLLGGFPPSAPGQSQTQPPASTIPSFLGQSHRNPGPDLYRFADMVLDSNLYHDSSSLLGKAPAAAQPQAPIYHQHSYY